MKMKTKRTTMTKPILIDPKMQIMQKMSLSIIPKLKWHGMTIIPNSDSLDAVLRNPRKIANFAVSKDGCFERAGTVKIEGVNPAKSGFVDLKRNHLTI